jgi:hypothetical protein
MVFADLDSAKTNGYFEPGKWLHGMDAEGIAEDMIMFAADLMDRDPEELIPHISEWLELQARQ